MQPLRAQHTRKWTTDFKKPSKKEDNFYDLYDDYALIEASFLQQYGIRLRETEDLSWDEFCTYLAGLGEKTPLGKIVAIRSETDKNILKNFTAEQKRIRNEWSRKQFAKMTEQEKKDMLKKMEDSVKKAFS